MRSSWYRCRACTVVTAVSPAVKLATSIQETTRLFGVMSLVCGMVDGVSRRRAQQDPPHFLGGLGPQLDETLDAVEVECGVKRSGWLRSLGLERLSLDESRQPGDLADPAVQQGVLIDARPARC